MVADVVPPLPGDTQALSSFFLLLASLIPSVAAGSGTALAFRKARPALGIAAPVAVAVAIGLVSAAVADAIAGLGHFPADRRRHRAVLARGGRSDRGPRPDQAAAGRGGGAAVHRGRDPRQRRTRQPGPASARPASGRSIPSCRSGWRPASCATWSTSAGIPPPCTCGCWPPGRWPDWPAWSCSRPGGARSRPGPRPACRRWSRGCPAGAHAAPRHARPEPADASGTADFGGVEPITLVVGFDDSGPGPTGSHLGRGPAAGPAGHPARGLRRPSAHRQRPDPDSAAPRWTRPATTRPPTWPRRPAEIAATAGVPYTFERRQESPADAMLVGRQRPRRAPSPPASPSS